MYKQLNNDINSFIIQHITRLYNKRDFDGLKQMGLSKDSASRVANLPMLASARLSEFRVQIGDIFVDEKRLGMMIDRNQHEGAKNTIIDQMILMDSSQSMLFELAGIEHVEYRDRRKSLDLPKASSGRPSALNEDESIDVYNAWREYLNEEDLLLRYYLIGMKTKISLARIWQYMQIQN